MENQASWLDKNRHVIFGVMLAAVLAGGTIFYLRQPAAEPIEIVAPEPTATKTPAATATPGPVRVYVTGAVAHVDVYVLPQGSIIKDAVEAAGGFTPDADPERINLALELADQQQIHVPGLDEQNPPPPVQDAPSVSRSAAAGNTGSAAGEQINLNTATLEQLDSLSGIGPAIGQRIIDYREKIGGFQNIEQITEVSGVGEATFAKIKDSITVGP